jgi:hypothetical protein
MPRIGDRELFAAATRVIALAEEDPNSTRAATRLAALLRLRMARQAAIAGQWAQAARLVEEAARYAPLVEPIEEAKRAAQALSVEAEQALGRIDEALASAFDALSRLVGRPPLPRYHGDADGEAAEAP